MGERIQVKHGYFTRTWWVLIPGLAPKSFLTHAEAISYADQAARKS